MAKEDFCFTYYDGDAARDKAHLNRLQRGAYDDLISAQRKFGRLSFDQVKRVLGNDFDSCWDAIEWVLKKDDEGKYFIEWLENSVLKSRAAAKKQKEKVEKRWQKENNGNSTVIPQYNSGNAAAIPLEDDYGNENVNEKKGKEGTGEKEEKTMDNDLLLELMLLDKDYLREMEAAGVPPSKIEKWMQAFNRYLRFKGVRESGEVGWRLGFPAWLKHQNLKTEPENYKPANYAKNERNNGVIKLVTETERNYSEAL